MRNSKSDPAQKQTARNLAEPRVPGIPSGSPSGGPGPAPVDILKGRKYMQLSDAEKRQYLSERALKIAQIIGNNSSEAIPPAALEKVKSFTEGFASRLRAKGMNGCPSRRPWGDNLQATYDRASKNAPFIIKAFNEKGVDPHRPLSCDDRIGTLRCLQSETGPLGMFQLPSRP